MRDYYVILTGAKNNAGDYLIAKRAKELLKKHRPDREIVELNRWLPINNKDLSKINGSKALLLIGGPSIRSNMYPKVFPLRENLDEIKVPISIFGGGQKLSIGDDKEKEKFEFDSNSLKLLDKIKKTGQLVSVRDWITWDILAQYNFTNTLMTGCPAYYYPNSPKKNHYCPSSNEVNRVVFSLGVSLVNNPEIKDSVKKQILILRDFCGKDSLTVAFHHSLNKDKIIESYGETNQLFHANKDFCKWLISQGIEFIDVSGGYEKFVEFYLKQDMHVGYRVHAHVLMSSLGKLTCLLTEDGRGKGVDTAVGGVVLEGVKKTLPLAKFKGASRLPFIRRKELPNTWTTSQFIKRLEYELRNGKPVVRAVSAQIDENYMVMQKYLDSLP